MPANEVTVGSEQEERVAVLTVAVANNDRAADVNAVLLRKARKEFGWLTVGWWRALAQLAAEADARGEELRQYNPRGTLGGCPGSEAFAGVQVVVDVASFASVCTAAARTVVVVLFIIE
ncbi:hypothetical protein MAUB1S_00889 [Mycolicibacterium aubagnense]